MTLQEIQINSCQLENFEINIVCKKFEFFKIKKNNRWAICFFILKTNNRGAGYLPEIISRSPVTAVRHCTASRSQV